ncbi:MAG: serpin family protein, partial [Acidimicrobiales bacterium]|nr:serpin family protein [Acidimicrobiales bacterium]
AGAAITQFGNELFKAARDPAANSVVSPVSVAIALAMLERGATGDAQRQLASALHIADAKAFHASMTALGRHLAAAKPTALSTGDKPGELQIAIANALFAQAGYPIRSTYTDALSLYYGPTLRTVDFKQPSAVDAINQFVAEGTRNHIRDILDTLPPETVLALVNALYLKASWLEPFEVARTTDHPFTPPAGAPVTVKMMHGTTFKSMKGDGWVAGTKHYTGTLSIEFVLPDAGRFDEVANNLAAVFDALGRHQSGGGSAELAVPRFTTRFKAELKPALAKLGIVAPYAKGNLLGIAGDPALVLDKAIHATFLTMDETGTEAAAATVLTGMATSAPATPPPAVILERPFLFRIVESDTGATLFTGQVLNPGT